jgi:hypothetical protein
VWGSSRALSKVKTMEWRVVNRHPNVPEAFKELLYNSARFVPCEQVHDCAALRSPVAIFFPSRQPTTHHSSAGDELRDQASFCDPLGLVL